MLRSFPIPSLNTLGSFVFELCSGQTDKQTDSNILPTPTESVGVRNKSINQSRHYIYTAPCVAGESDARYSID